MKKPIKTFLVTLEGKDAKKVDVETLTLAIFNGLELEDYELEVKTSGPIPLLNAQGK